MAYMGIGTPGGVTVTEPQNTVYNEVIRDINGSLTDLLNSLSHLSGARLGPFTTQVAQVPAGNERVDRPPRRGSSPAVCELYAILDSVDTARGIVESMCSLLEI